MFGQIRGHLKSARDLVQALKVARKVADQTPLMEDMQYQMRRDISLIIVQHLLVPLKTLL